MDNIINDLRSGMTDKEVAKKYHKALVTIKSIRSKYIGISQIYVKALNANPEFESYFKELHNDNSKTINEIAEILGNHPIFKRKKMSDKRVSEIRKFYNIPPRMEERVYDNDYDRIRGYIIRNSKYMAKRRGIHFDLKYTDFEAPEYCPILNIKLKYLTEGNANDPAHASLDRIDNSKGYIKGNVIVISRLANAMKNAATFDQLLLFSENMSKLITHYKTQGALGSITDVFEFSPKLSLDS